MAGMKIADKPVKRTRVPSAYNKYMALRLAEMKADAAFMAENPDHRQRFKLAANELSGLTPDEKTEYAEKMQKPEAEPEPVPEPPKVAEKPKRGRPAKANKTPKTLQRPCSVLAV
jgi:cell division protein FtsN